MSRAAVKWSVPAVLGCLALLGPIRPATAQTASEPEKVKIQTVDGVELRAYFYQSPKKNAPTVLVLHKLGEHSQTKGWKDLAATLQPNYSVMLFDFRGHGESKDVEPTIFWKYQPNVSYAAPKSGVGKSTIEYKHFEKTGLYNTFLINDIAAVKGYLDRRSDNNGGCNTSSFILIGAETGAALGTIWLNSEWSRHKVSFGMGVGLQMDARPEGKDTIAAIWLSISSKVSTGKRLDIGRTLEAAAGSKGGGTPMVFMYGSADEPGQKLATAIDKTLKGTTKVSNLKYTGPVALKGTKLTGEELLQQKSLKVDAAILKYLEQVVSDKGNEWAEHDYRRSQYVWKMGVAGPPAVAKPAGEMNPVFEGYDKFGVWVR